MLTRLGMGDIDALQALRSDTFGEWGPEVQVTQEMIGQFASVTRDLQWIHTDPKRAAEGPFKAPIAHGFLTLGLLSALRPPTTIELHDAQLITHVGGQYEFKRPVMVGNTIRGRERLQDVMQMRKAVQLTFGYEIQIVETSKNAATGSIKLLYS